MFKIEHSQLISCIAIFCFGWESHKGHKSTDLAKKNTHRIHCMVKSHSIGKNSAELYYSLICGKFCIMLFAEQSDRRVSFLP